MFWSYSFCVIIFLVQFYVILVRNGVLYWKNKSSNLFTIFYYVIVTVYIYSWIKIDTILTLFGDALCTFFTFFYHFLDVICSHVVAHLYNGVTSPWVPSRRAQGIPGYWQSWTEHPGGESWELHWLRCTLHLKLEEYLEISTAISMLDPRSLYPRFQALLQLKLQNHCSSKPC